MTEILSSALQHHVLRCSHSLLLIERNLSKVAFVATGIVITCLVDFSRLRAYVARFSEPDLQENVSLVLVATLSAYIGNEVLKKVALKVVQNIVTVMLLLHSTALGQGIV